MIGPLTPADLPAVLAIEQASATRPWSAERFRDELARPDRTYLIAREEGEGGQAGEVVGFVGGALQAGAVHVMTVAVAPSARRRGHGSALVAALVEDALDRGADGVTLEVRATEEPAQRLYRRLGFRSAGVRPGYYPDGEDAVIMWWRPDADGAEHLVVDAEGR